MSSIHQFETGKMPAPPCGLPGNLGTSDRPDPMPDAQIQILAGTLASTFPESNANQFQLFTPPNHRAENAKGPRAPRIIPLFDLLGAPAPLAFLARGMRSLAEFLL